MILLLEQMTTIGRILDWDSMKRLFFAIFSVVVTLSFATSCHKEPLNHSNHQLSDSKIYLWASKPDRTEDEDTKVIYHDGLGISGDGAPGFRMEWEPNDTLYAIMWDDAGRDGKGQATDKYIVLIGNSDTSRSELLFEGTPHGFNINKLVGGEHFVLVHGHFVLDPDTDGGVLDFPTSEVTKAGYASHIHHGGVEDSDGNLTFRNQNGTLANLKRHEYMVADSYVRFQQVTVDDGNGGNTKIRVPYLGKGKRTYTKDEYDSPGEVEEQGVQLLSAHTLIRLTLFVPDYMFDENIDYRVLAVSMRTAENSPIFHRYFRLHPNTRGIYGPAGWKEDWNTNNDKESNIYFRANLPGNRNYKTENDPLKSEFNPEQTVCVKGKAPNGTEDGHYVTLYFSLPSRPLAPSADDGTVSGDPSHLFVTTFTRTHAYRSVKSYYVANDKMKPAKIINLNVNYHSGPGADGKNYIKIPAVTDPNLGVTFAPGIVYASRPNSNAAWSYGIYTNQGEYAGLNQQTDCMGNYFIFGSVDPTEVYHQHKDGGGNWVDHGYGKSSSWNIQSDLTIDNDVAAKAVYANQDNVFSTMSEKEAARVWAQIQKEAQLGVNKGFYYYDASDHDTDYLHHTAHQAVGAHISSFLNSGGKETSENIERKKTMSSSMGIWIGINRQPTLAEQDMYVFLPSSHQLNNSISNMQWYDSELHEWFDNEGEITTGESEAGYENVEQYRYAASADYGKQHVYCIEKAAYDKLSSTEKDKFRNIPTTLSNGTVLDHYYLINTRTVGKATEYGLEGEEYSRLTMKFSTNTRDVSTSKNCYRFQVWYASGTTFSNSGIGSMDQTFGRVVRPVIY